MSTNYLHQRTTLTPEHTSEGSPISDADVRHFLAIAPMSTSRCIARVIRRPTSRRAPAGFGNACNYDWSDLNRVVLTTTDSKRLGRGRQATLTPSRRAQPNGTTDIDVVVIREGKNLRGRMLGFALGTIGRRVLEGLRKLSQGYRSAERREAAYTESGLKLEYVRRTLRICSATS